MIYVDDHAPAHVHVIFDRCSARVLIDPDRVSLVETFGKAKRNDVRCAVEVVAKNLAECLEMWEKLHGDKGEQKT